MLVLGRKVGQSVVINGNITVTVCEIRVNGTIRLGIEAPREISVHRWEIQRLVNAQAQVEREGTDE